VSGRAAVSRPSFPRKAGPADIHPECGDRLIVHRRLDGSVERVVHESTGTRHCPPLVRTCTICEKDGLVKCSEPGCPVIGHPGSCVLQCSCCMSYGCPAHVSNIDFLCISCSGHKDVDFEHDGVPR
jgi:hypothetical protein